MGKITVIAVLSVVMLAATTFALDVGVGGSYAPGYVAGGASINNGVDRGGFKGRISLGIYEDFNLAIGFGYNEFVYRRYLLWTEEQPAVESIPMVILTLGADYAFPTGPFRPFVGGGAAIARESAEARGYTAIDWYGGLYVEGGARYFVVNSFALEAGPRYTHLFDEPVVYYKDYNVRGFVRSEHRSQLIELLVGVNYYF